MKAKLLACVVSLCPVISIAQNAAQERANWAETFRQSASPEQRKRYEDDINAAALNHAKAAQKALFDITGLEVVLAVGNAKELDRQAENMRRLVEIIHLVRDQKRAAAASRAPIGESPSSTFQAEEQRRIAEQQARDQENRLDEMRRRQAEMDYKLRQQENQRRAREFEQR